MATTTPNFGWSVPTSSDLVKNGAVAIETLGDSIDASLVDLKGGTTGQVLSKASNTDMDFTWATAAGGGGKVLQVVQATTTTSTSVASTSYTDTGLSATITPSSASSKILVLVNQRFRMERSNDSINMASQLLRGATVVYLQEFDANLYIAGTTLAILGGYSNANYLDSPATTSAITYKTQGKVSTTSNGGVVVFQEGSTISSIILMEIGA